MRANPIGLRDVFFTPGLHLVGDKIAFIKQMPMFETPTIGDADVVLADAGTGQILNTVHVNQKVRKLLAVGKRWAPSIFLTNLTFLFWIRGTAMK